MLSFKSLDSSELDLEDESLVFPEKLLCISARERNFFPESLIKVEKTF